MSRIDLSRRQFLGNAAGISAAAVGFPYIVSATALGANGAVAASERITMGCIGMGGQGTGDMRGFLGKREVRVVGVCDVNRHNAERAKGFVDKKYGNSDCVIYHDFRDLIARRDIDTMLLALPDHWHSIPVVTAARAGKDMYAEKPLARTIHECKVMRDTVNQYNRIWQTGSWQRSVENFHHACELVRNGRIGKVTHVEVGLPTGSPGKNNPVQPVPEGVDWDFWLGPAPKVPFRGVLDWNWRWVMDYSGGQLTDWAGHHIDIAHWGLGFDNTGPVQIEGKGVYPKDGIYNVPIEYKFTCKYANGVEMVVANDRQLPHGMGTAWYGDKGWIHVARGRQATNPPGLWKEVIGPEEIHLYKSRDHEQNFLDCVKSRRKTITPINVACRSITVGLLGEIAMLLGRKIHWDPVKEEIVNDPEASRLLERPMRAPWHL